MILAKKISRKEGESPRKKEIPLRLCSSAPLREQKKNISQRRRGSKIKTPLRLGAFASLREEKSAAADPQCCGTGSKEGESPRKKEIPLRLSYFASLREQKKNVSLSAAADPKCCGTGSKENTPFARRKKNISQRRGAAKEGRNPFAPFLLCVFA